MVSKNILFYPLKVKAEIDFLTIIYIPLEKVIKLKITESGEYGDARLGLWLPNVFISNILKEKIV